MNQKLSKLTKSALQMKRYEHIFRCPICQTSMKIVDLKSFVCAQNHTFDMARQGHMNLLTSPSKSNYNTSLFTARRAVIMSNLFKPLTDEISALISKHTDGKSSLSIIDMGSGEGSHLHNIHKILERDYYKNPLAFGIDISKEGILETAKNYEEIIWLVADLANSPFVDNTFDMILNILSPSNYEEFSRIIKPDGMIIKVVPGRNYLQEIRNFFYKNNEQQKYSNTDVIKGFTEKFSLIDHITLEYTEILNQTNLQSLIQMTPLTWNVSNDKIKEFLQRQINEITIHLEVLLGKK